MRRPRYRALVDKSVEASIAAIDIYNKPDFRYREEAFSILMLNAWELLLKARVMKENKNDERSIEVWEPRVKKDSTKSKRFEPKRNRSGNIMTIGLNRAAALVREYNKDAIDERCIENLNVLTEIRDTSAHLLHITPGLGKRIQEVGSAALRNYVHASETWFDVDLSRYNFYLMPLSFHSPVAVLESLTQKHQPEAVRKLPDYITETEHRHPSNDNQAFNVTLQVEVRFVRTPSTDAIPVQVTKDPTAIPVQVSEENIRQAYPWDYVTLIRKIKSRYSDFVQNQTFYKLKARIETDVRYSRPRHLDPNKPKGITKRFYSPNIMTELDKNYTKQ